MLFLNEESIGGNLIGFAPSPVTTTTLAAACQHYCSIACHHRTPSPTRYYELDCDSSIAVINGRSLRVESVIIAIGPTNDLLW